MKRAIIGQIATVFSCAVLALLLAGCGADGAKVTLADEPSNDPPVQTVAETEEPSATTDYAESHAVVNEVENSRFYHGVGSFEAYEQVSVSAKVGGTIISLPHDEGESVSADTIIARIDPEDFQLGLKNAKAQLGVAEANLSNARSEYQRKKKLYEDGAIPESQFDQFKTGLELAEAQMQSAQVAVEIAQKALRDTVRKAGVRGVISKRFMEVGEYIASGDPLLEVSVLNPIKLLFSVPQRLAAEIAEGARVEATVSAYPGRSFTGMVTLVSPTLDARSRTVLVEAEFDNSDQLIKPGFFAECDVEISRQVKVFVVPEEALFEVNGNFEVRVRRNESVENVPVRLIGRTDGTCEVTGELQVGDMVLQRQR